MTTYKKVEWLLANVPKLRDDDMSLMITIWEREGLVLSSSQKAILLRCTKPETITRARRDLKEQYPASKTVDALRFNKYMAYKHSRAYQTV